MSDYFTDEQIIRQVCKERIKTAKAASKRRDVLRLVGKQEVVTSNTLIHTLLPPRRKWAAFRPPNRGRVPDVNYASLCHATLDLRESEPGSPWAVNLNHFIGAIRHRVFSDQPFRFNRPRIKFEVKEENKYRPLCRFTLEDNVINCLVAKYLRDFCDPAFEPSSYAFRGLSDKAVMPTHHAAFEEIHRLKSAAPARDFYVAECDIRAFYDTVDHRITLQGLQQAVARVQILRPERKLQPRAAVIFQAYLDSYNFPHNVLQAALPEFRVNHSRAEVPWPEEDLVKSHGQSLSEPIGVPQGGALSCVIANLVLDLADKRVRAIEEQLGTKLHYFRYCDDMVLVADQECQCREAFQAYLSALKELKLPYHLPVTVSAYDRAFWKAKSKNPYCWSGRKGPGCVPWVQFVGYQIRYDGLIRIKTKSIKKHLRKIRHTGDHVTFGIWNERAPYSNPSTVATKDQVFLSLRWKLASLGVGRVNLKDGSRSPRRMCWAGGYKALHGKPLVPSFLKRLDRAREKQIRRMDQAEIAYGSGVSPEHKGKGGRPNPVGYPFSYLAQFENAGGLRLINHPFRPWFQRFVTHPAYIVAKYPKRLLRVLGRMAQRWARIPRDFCDF